MKAGERVKLRKAIALLHGDEGAGGDYDAGMRILCELAGLEFPAASVKTRPVSLQEVAARPDGEFRVRGSEEDGGA